MATPPLEEIVQKPELVEVFDLQGNPLGPMERDEFYEQIREEFERTGKITRQVKSIRAFLLSSTGMVYIQKRGPNKRQNPSLYDKPIAGHVPSGISYELTLVKEAAEELAVPVAITPAEEFDLAVRSINLDVVGIFRQIDYISPFLSVRVEKDGTKFPQPFMSSFFIGYYNGTIRFSHEESTGIEVFSLDQLKREIQVRPQLFTEDKKFMIEKYAQYLVPLRKS